MAKKARASQTLRTGPTTLRVAVEEYKRRARDIGVALDAMRITDTVRESRLPSSIKRLAYRDTLA
jgi:hypothetical protein